MELLNVIETRLQKAEAVKQSNDHKSSFSKNILNNHKALSDYFETKKSSNYLKKEILFKEGDGTNYLYYVSSGKVRTFKLNDQTKEFTTGLYSEGDFLGYLSILQDVDQPDTAVVLENSEIVKIPKDDFKHLVSTNSDVAQEFLNMLTSNVLEKEKEMLGLAYNSVRKRVSDALLLLYTKFNTQEDELFTIAISRDNLASIVDTTTESVIRVLSDFKSEGLISISGSKITIVELKKLIHMKN